MVSSLIRSFFLGQKGGLYRRAAQYVSLISFMLCIFTIYVIVILLSSFWHGKVWANDDRVRQVIFQTVDETARCLSPSFSSTKCHMSLGQISLLHCSQWEWGRNEWLLKWRLPKRREFPSRSFRSSPGCWFGTPVQGMPDYIYDNLWVWPRVIVNRL